MYDKYIVAFSGGKDSTAAFLHLIDQGIKKSKIELWHHEIDGRNETFMDWPCTPDYCRAFAEAFDVPIFFSWKKGGFKREMLRLHQRTAPTVFEVPKYKLTDPKKYQIEKTTKEIGGNKGKKSTRRKFPQVSGDLSVRWCSAYLKIDVCASAIRNQKRFQGKKVCVISGERAEESQQRACYNIKEPDKSDLRNSGRWIDRLRPVLYWKEEKIWKIIKKYKVRVHPCYYLGWGRCSCLFCIFGNKNQVASAYKVSPYRGQQIAEYEKEFGCTIKRKKSWPELRDEGTPYPGTNNQRFLKIARSYTYDLPIFMDNWVLPAGAYGESCGPT